MAVDLLAWAERFIATPSVSADGNGRIAAHAAELLRLAGLEPRIEPVRVCGTLHHAVLAELGPQTDDGLLLLTHLDTVPAGDPRRWTATAGDPLRPTRQGDRLYGLGSADAKVDFVCKVAALAELDAARLTRRIRIVGTFGEEIGLLGTRWLIESGHTRGFRYALVGEPSELVAIHAHKGYAVFEATIETGELAAGPSAGETAGGAGWAAPEAVEFEGASVHSSTPQLGRNAIEAMLEALAGEDVVGWTALAGGTVANRVPDRASATLVRRATAGRGSDPDAAGGLAPVYKVAPLLRFHEAWRGFLAQLAEPRDARFDPDHSVASLGRVRLGERGRVIFGFDLRPIPGVDAESLVAPLREVAELVCLRRNPALATPLDSPLLRAVTTAQRTLGLAARSGTKATCTEAGLLAEAGLEVLVLGPGLSVGNVHRPNEYTEIPQLSQARDLYSASIAALCTAEGPTCSS